MNKFKRILSALLVLVMCLSMLPAQAFAEAEEAAPVQEATAPAQQEPASEESEEQKQEADAEEKPEETEGGKPAAKVTKAPEALEGLVYTGEALSL